MKTKSVLRSKLQLAFGCAVLALLVVGAASYRSVVESTERDLWVRHTHEVLENMQDLLGAMQAVESNARGYLLTGDESFIEIYRADIAKTEKDEAIVRSLTADNAGQQQRLDTLAILTAQKFQLAEKVLYLRRTNRLQAAATAIPEGSGKHILDDVQELAGQMQGEELRLLAVREGDARRRSAQTKIVLIVGTLLSLLITTVAGWSVQRDNSESKDSGAKYRGLLEAAPDAMVVVNQGGQIVLLNVQAEKQFGYSRDELIGQKVKNIIPKGFAERLIADGTRSAAEALAQQIGTGIELIAKRKDGTEFPIEIMLSPLESTEGTLVTAAIRDISVRRAAEKHLAQMEGRYRGLLEAAPDAMVVVNKGGEIVLLNVQAEKQFGYSRDELVGQKVTNVIPEGFAERLVADALRPAAEALAQQIGTGIELIGRRKDGTQFPIELMLSPLESAEGTLVTAAIRDISVRRDAEIHLARMEGRYRGLLEAAPDAMVVVNQAGEIVLLNVRAEKEFG